jgi:DNA-binding response OmpR family regulator
MARLLVVDDDPHILELVSHVLGVAGYQTVTAPSGHAALEAASREPFDLVVLDVLLPGIDGREVCRRLRKNGMVPVLMLTALGELHHKLQGFDAGADDYLAKPFEPGELVARVRALLKRSSTHNAGTADPGLLGAHLSIGRLLLDGSGRTVEVEGVRKDLPPKEFDLLTYLGRSPGRLFTRDQILDAVWGQGYAGQDRTVDVYINRVRNRFPEESHGYRIVGVRGIGYRLEVTK